MDLIWSHLVETDLTCVVGNSHGQIMTHCANEKITMPLSEMSQDWPKMQIFDRTSTD